MEATTGRSLNQAVDDVWTIGVTSDATPAILVTDPDGDPAVATLVDGTTYEWTVALDAPGRWIASVTSAEGVQHFTVYVTAVVDGTGMPDLDEVKTYLKIPLDDETEDVDIADALDAEAGAQRSVCRVPAAYPTDLRQALKRRVARNLALRGLPIMVLRGDAEAGSTIPPGRDAEVRRLEAPFRKLVMG